MSTAASDIADPIPAPRAPGFGKNVHAFQPAPMTPGVVEIQHDCQPAQEFIVAPHHDELGSGASDLLEQLSGRRPDLLGADGRQEPDPRAPSIGHLRPGSDHFGFHRRSRLRMADHPDIAGEFTKRGVGRTGQWRPGATARPT